MSAPEVGDRVRVIAGQWTGWEGVVTGTSRLPYLWVDLGQVEDHHGTVYPRTLYAHEVEKVPTTPTDGHHRLRDANPDPDQEATR